jgi:hypothetical protein
MLRINDIIFSLDLLEKKFSCNLRACLGNCCRYGDSGAPLSDSEAVILEEIWPQVRSFLRPEGIAVIEAKGRSIRDFEGDLVTPLISDEECAYAILDEDIIMCGIEKAWQAGKISFRKPLSCHLFPARIRSYRDFKAVNYQELAICHPACKKGKKENIPLYRFLKEPLIRAFGEEIYNDLCIAAAEFKRDNTIL